MSPTATTRTHKHVLTPWSKQSAVDTPTITRGQGSYLYDESGKRYLDLSAGLVAVNLGHGHPAVVDAIKRQAEKLSTPRRRSSTTSAASSPPCSPRSRRGTRAAGSSSPPTAARATRTP